MFRINKAKGLLETQLVDYFYKHCHWESSLSSINSISLKQSVSMKTFCAKLKDILLLCSCSFCPLSLIFLLGNKKSKNMSFVFCLIDIFSYPPSVHCGEL